MMIGSLMMIKIINNIEHYSFFFMALANTDQPPALNNVHQTTPSGAGKRKLDNIKLHPPYTSTCTHWQSGGRYLLTTHYAASCCHTQLRLGLWLRVAMVTACRAGIASGDQPWSTSRNSEFRLRGMYTKKLLDY